MSTPTRPTATDGRRAVDEIVSRGPGGRVRGRGRRDRDRRRDLLRLLLLRLPAARSRAVSDVPRRRARSRASRSRPSGAGRIVVAIIIVAAGRDDGRSPACTGRRCRRRASRPSTRARCTSRASSSRATSAPRSDADGKVMVRLIAQQYSFEPQCIVVPAEMPVTFRGTSTDVDPRLRRRHDQRQHDADPGLRRDVHDHVPRSRASS